MNIKRIFLLMICGVFMIGCNKISEPTDYAINETNQPQIMYSDKIYFHESIVYNEELPEGFTKVGVVKSVNNDIPPTHNFYGANVKEGQEIFATPNMDSTLYIKYESGYAKYVCHELTDSTELDRSVEQSQIYINMAEKRIEIPEYYILGICKNLQSNDKMVYDKDMMVAICDEINSSEIVQISIDNQEVIRTEGMEDFLQYPILFETICKDDFVAINLLSKKESEYYVQLRLTVPSDNLKNVNDYSLEDSIDGKRYINCFIKSEKLYHDIEHFWGPKTTIDDIQNPEKIILFYNGSNSIHTKDYSEITEVFSNEDAKKFTKKLQEDAYKVYDDHSFGITITISMRNNKNVNIYYADDGCSMFQFEGESYNLDPNGTASSILKLYIQKLEEKINEKYD